MLAHGRRDGYTFCDHEGYGVHSHGNGSRAQARSRLVERRRSIVVTAVARHGDKDVVSRLCMRQETNGRSERVVTVVGTSAAIFVNYRRHASSGKWLPGAMVVIGSIAMICSTSHEHVEQYW